MLDYIYYMTLKLLKKRFFGVFWSENARGFSYFRQRYNGRHYVKLLICTALWFIDFIRWYYVTPRHDVMW